MATHPRIVRALRFISSVVLYLCLGTVSLSQQPIRNDTVFVNVTAIDKASKPFTRLRQEHFKVFEKNEPLEITFFDSTEQPLSIALLFDFSSSMTVKRRNAAVLAADSIAEAGNQLNDYRFTVFSASARSFCDDGCTAAELPALLAKLDTSYPGRNTAFFDSCLAALKTLKSAANRRRALVVFSDGQDTFSRAIFNDVRDALRRSNVTLYAFTLVSDSDEGSSLNIEGREILEKLTEMSGGDAFFSKERKDVPEIAKLIAQEMRYQYTLGFKPALKTADQQPHSIKIRLEVPTSEKVPSLSLRYRQYYFTN